MNPLQPQARLFRLVRHTNPTAILAEGVEWSDGAATLRWRGPWPSTSTWDDGIPALLATHAPDPRTQLHWTDTPLSSPAPPTSLSPPTSTTVTDRTKLPAAIWLPASTPDGLCTNCGRPWPCLTCGP